MRQKQLNRALRRIRGVVPAVVVTAGLVAGATVTAAPAFADAGPLGLAVHAPVVIGAAGAPVTGGAWRGLGFPRTGAV
ncbi:hypothetical protein OG535_14720 [Kitasatospora sp. NBC_00085]|uniref:hypothetical protein n=1 Tax=unclassified Kitasatospora TaxID=2633591 RepID=UPI003246832E